MDENSEDVLNSIEKYTEEVDELSKHKQFAFELYLRGLTPSKIVEAIKTEYEKEYKVSTIYSWANGAYPKWADLKASTEYKAMAEVVKDSVADVMMARQEQIEVYREVKDKALEDYRVLPFEKAIEAARAVEIGLAGERQLMGGALNMQLVMDVMMAVKAEVNDEDVLRRIAIRLQALTEKYQKENQ